MCIITWRYVRGFRVGPPFADSDTTLLRSNLRIYHAFHECDIDAENHCPCVTPGLRYIAMQIPIYFLLSNSAS